MHLTPPQNILEQHIMTQALLSEDLWEMDKKNILHNYQHRRLLKKKCNHIMIKNLKVL